MDLARMLGMVCVFIFNMFCYEKPKK
jgi:hypothetical protein